MNKLNVDLKSVQEMSKAELEELVTSLREMRAVATVQTRKSTTRRTASSTKPKRQPKTIAIADILARLTPEQQKKFLGLAN